MTSRFNSDDPAGITLAAGESDRDRAEAFLRAFDLKPGTEQVFVDASGHPLAIAPSWTTGLDRYAASELERAGQAIARPIEIWLLWKPGAEDQQLLTRRYIGLVDGIDVVVDVNRAGWRFATSLDSGFSLERLRSGELVWRSSQA